MSRHRNVRTMNYDDDYEGYYDVYGRSQEEDSCISPTTEEQFLYNRDKLHSMSSFLSPDALQEENEDEDDGEEAAQKSAPSEAQLSPVDEVRLYECIEKMQNVVGDSIPEATLRRAALEGDFNAEVALDRLLREADKPKPQREPRDRRRESDDEDALCDPPTSTSSFAVWDSGGRRGGRGGGFLAAPQHAQTVVAHFDVPSRRLRGKARQSCSGAVPRFAKTDSVAASEFSFPSPLGRPGGSSSLSCELQLDGLLKLGDAGRGPERTGGLSKDARDGGGCESDHEVSVSSKSSDSVAVVEKFRKASSVEDLLESLLQTKSPERDSSGQNSTDCVSGTGDDAPCELRLDDLLKSGGAGTDEGRELRLDDLLKLGGGGRASEIGCEPERTGDALKSARVGVAFDSISFSRDAPNRETPGSTKLPSIAMPVPDDCRHTQGAHKTASGGEFSKSPLKKEDSSEENPPQRDPMQCLSDAMSDELEALLGMIASTKPSHQSAKTQESPTSPRDGSNPSRAVTTPAADAVEDSLDALLGISASSKQGGAEMGKSELDDFLMSLGSDSPRKSASVKPSDGVTSPSILDILSGTSKVEKSPVKVVKKADRKEPNQPALLNLGEILGLNRGPSSGLLGESGALNLNDILKNAVNSASDDKEKLEGGDEVTGFDLSLLQPATTVIPVNAVPAKEASLFGKVLVFFPLRGRRRVAMFGVEDWLKKLDVLLQSKVGETARFDFGTPSPDDIVLACREKASNSSERKPAPPVEEESAVAKVPILNKDTLPAANRALRQSFGMKPPDPNEDGNEDEDEVEREEKPRKLSSGNLKVPSATNSSRSSPDPDRKEPSPEAAGDAQPAAEAATPKTPRPKASSKDVAAEYAKERGANKALLNLVVIGHVDAGKSTLMGHLLYRLGCVQKKQMHKYEQESKKLGKASFMYAWVLDETSEERNRGITMDVAQAKFETPNRSIVLLDAPGHRDFIPNMITGAAQADVAILVVDATRGEFETGFEMGGQTREHTLLVRSLGVSQLAVAINKLDNVSWDEARYNEITAKLRSFLRQAGYRESDFTFVPCSGLTGENLIVKPAPDSPLTKWYSGPCLVDVIDNFKPPERPVSKPFRLCVSDVFKGMGSGFCVSGRVDAGCVANGDKVLVMPAAEQGTVKGITIDEVPVPQAFAGDQVALTLSGVDMIKVTTGSFVCDPAVPIRVSTRFQARLVVFNIEVPLTRGFPVVLHYQSTSEQASIHRILSQLNKGTGEVVRSKPRCLVKNTSGLVEIKVCRPMCVELYKEFKELGRITLRSGGSTVAAGVITEVM